MARVPVLNAPTVQATPRPSRLPAAESFGVDQRAVQTVAGGLANVAEAVERETMRLDEIRANEAEVQFRARVDRAWADPKDGLAHQRGTRAVEGLDPFRDRLRTSMSEVEAGLATERQKALFRLRADRIARDADVRAGAHVGDEVRAVDAESHRALLAADEEAVGGAARVGDAVGAEAAIRRMSERVALYGDRNGATPEAIAQARRAIVSAGRMRQVDALVSAGRVEDAATLLKDRGGELLAEDRAKVEAALVEAQERSAIVTAADRILATATSATEANELVGNLPLELRAPVRKYVEAEYAAQEEAQKRDQEQAYIESTNMVDAAPNRPAREVVPVRLWQQLTVAQREALENRATAPANDNKAWFAFYSLTPEARAKLTPAEFQTKYWSRFDSAHRSRAETMYQSATTDASGTGGGAAGIMTDSERIRATLVSMHLVSQPVQRDWTDADYQFATTFEMEADRRIRAEEANRGRRLTASEKQDIITTTGWQMAPVNVRGRGLDRTNVSQVEVRQDGVSARAYVPIDRIPPAAREEMARAMQQNGRAVTNRALEDAYGAFLMNERNRYDILLGRAVPPDSF